jgi:uncharacterized protein
LLIVAVHDVAPSTLGQVRWLLSRLDDEGIRPRVLKVVPGQLEASDEARGELAALVSAEARAGSEIVLHGWTHRAEAPYRAGAADRLRARLFAGRAAEFLALDRPQMGDRLRAGRDWLMSVGQRPLGFCAPAWLWAPELPDAARAAGFRYLVGLRGLIDLRSNGRISLPPVGYIGAGAGQEAAWWLGELTVWRPWAALQRGPARRYVLHPQGAARSRACARVLREIGRMAKRHRAGTYAQLLDA